MTSTGYPVTTLYLQDKAGMPRQKVLQLPAYALYDRYLYILAGPRLDQDPTGTVMLTKKVTS